MALTKCPECGKENISDSAISCPSCGYGIKLHFENIKIEEQKQLEIRKQNQVLEQEKQRKEKQLEQEKANKAKKIEEIAAKTELPKTKPFINGFLFMGFLFLAADIFLFLIGLGLIEGAEEGMPFLGISFFSVFAISCLILGYSILKDSRKLYDEYSHNQEEYKKELAAKTLREIEIQDAREKEKRKDKQNTIPKANKISTDTGENLKCPKCGSTQIQMVNRRWTIGTGFLTNKIDRVCINCKNKF